jgi:hypothetical protein
MENNQKIIFLDGANFEDNSFLVFRGNSRIIAIAITNAITPPNLLGMDRKIA